MRVGPYEVVSQVGRGGAGVVLRVRDASGRDLALKVLPPDVSEETRARFERERRLLASFGEKDGFVPLLGVIDTPNGAGLLMPFVPGGTLRAVLDRGPLGVDETVRLGRALARALGRAHARGVVHRDLKPENILFTGRDGTGEPLVADLGLAKHFRHDLGGASQSVRLSSDGALLGTAGYMPPEQLASASTAGPPCDVFALGAILHECLAGRPAFGGETVMEVLSRTEACRPEPLASLRPETPPWLRASIERSLLRDPARRHADGAELEASLDANPTAPRGGRKARVVALLVAALLVPVAAALVAWRAPLAGLDPTAGGGSPLGGTASPSSATANSSAGRLVARARAELGELRLHASIASAREAIALEPGLAAAWSVRGEAELARSSPEALLSLDRAVALAPRDSSLLILRARARRETGDRDGSRSDAEKALALDARSAPAHVELAKAALLRVDIATANAHAEAALALDPRLASAYEVRGAARMVEADSERGAADIARAVTLDPRTASAWLRKRGLVEVLPGGDWLLMAIGTHASGVKPQAWALALRANAGGDGKASLSDAERALSLDPRLAIAWIGRARALVTLGRDPDRQRKDADRAIELDPTCVIAFVFRSDIRNVSGDAAGALEDAERAIELEATNIWALHARALANAELHHLDAAIADLERFAAAGEAAVKAFANALLDELRRARGPRTETVWIDDANPKGATEGKEGERDWGWVERDPTPFSGQRALASGVARALHEMSVSEVEIPFAVRPGDKLFAWVWLDPANLPRQLELQWFDRRDRWEHRASWGASIIEREHVTKTPPANQGPLPRAGEWVLLEVPAEQVGLAGRLVRGMAFTLHGGRAAFDRIGTR